MCSMSDILRDARPFLESESSGDLGDALCVSLGGCPEIRRQTAVEHRNRRIVELVDFLESRRARAIPRLGNRGGNVFIVGGLGRKNVDPAHFGELAEHFFDVHRGEKEPIDVDVLQCAQRDFRLLHRDAVGNTHVIARVLGAARYVDGILSGVDVAENYEAGFGVSRRSAHLLSVVEFADYDVAKPETDLADHLRGYTRHQDFDGRRHLLGKVPLKTSVSHRREKNQQPVR